MKTRICVATGAVALLLMAGAAGVGAAVVTPPDTSGAATGIATSFDRAIELMVQQRVAAEKLSASDARIAREQLQLQFLSLSKAQQQTLLDATRSLDSGEAVGAARSALQSAVSSEARQVMDELLASARANLASGQSQRPVAKLGLGDSDLVLAATVGPCRTEL